MREDEDRLLSENLKKWSKRKEKKKRDDEEGKNSRRENEKITNGNKWKYEKEEVMNKS